MKNRNMPERLLFESILFLARVFRCQINLLLFNVLRAFDTFIYCNGWLCDFATLDYY